MAGIEFQARLGSAVKLSFRFARRIDPISGLARGTTDVARGLLVRQRHYGQSFKNGDGFNGFVKVNVLDLATTRVRETRSRSIDEILNELEWTG